MRVSSKRSQPERGAASPMSPQLYAILAVVENDAPLVALRATIVFVFAALCS